MEPFSYIKTLVTATEWDNFFRLRLHPAAAPEIFDLAMPEEVIKPAATSLILREYPEGPWTLAGTYGLQITEEEILAARLTIA